MQKKKKKETEWDPQWEKSSTCLLFILYCNTDNYLIFSYLKFCWLSLSLLNQAFSGEITTDLTKIKKNYNSIL